MRKCVAPRESMIGKMNIVTTRKIESMLLLHDYLKLVVLNVKYPMDHKAKFSLSAHLFVFFE